jgi:hypothetical protein
MPEAERLRIVNTRRAADKAQRQLDKILAQYPHLADCGEYINKIKSCFRDSLGPSFHFLQSLQAMLPNYLCVSIQC